MKRAINDQGSVTRQNLNFIEQESGCHNILEQCYLDIQIGLKPEVPEGELWRINFLKELTDLRLNNCYLEGDQFSQDEFASIVEYVSTT